MATLLHIPRKSGARAPQRITGINWSSPLAYGLKHAVRVQGGRAVEEVTGSPVVLNGNAAPGVGVLGSGITFDGTGDYADFASGFDQADKDELSWAVWHYATDLSSTPDLISVDVRESFIYRIVSTGLTANAYFRAGGGAYQSVAASGLTTVNTLQLIGASRDASNNMAVYENGQNRGTNSGSGGLYSFAGEELRLGINANDTARPYGGVIFHAWIWDRALIASEYAALYSPRLRWDLYKQSTRTYFIPAAAGGGFQPAWAARSTITISGGMTR